MRPAPAIRAAATICWPIPPQPTTHTLSPISTRAALRTAPKPVTTAQPSNAACHSGSSGGIGTALAAGTTQCSAKHETKLKCRTGAAVGEAQARRAVEQGARPRVLPGDLAEVEPARRACGTRPARRHEAERDTVARGETADARADGLDDAGALVPEHRRPAPVAEVAVGEADVGVAHARRRDPHQHLARVRRVEGQRLDAQRRARLVQHGGADLHQATRCSSRRSRSGTTPSPGPGRRRDRPVRRDLDRGPPSSQSRRSGVHPGGSNGTSM